ncbi:MAG: hypothetical protein D6741_04430 [Planctomycetota bacterium]|nr:MAG: hypothetical protein D6741_04430 [Planctomycetota bacterium]
MHHESHESSGDRRQAPVLPVLIDGGRLELCLAEKKTFHFAASPLPCLICLSAIAWVSVPERGVRIL